MENNSRVTALITNPSRKTKREDIKPLNKPAPTNRFSRLCIEAENTEQDLLKTDSYIENYASQNGNRQSAKFSKHLAIWVSSVSDPTTLNKSIGSSICYIRTSKIDVARIYTHNSDAFQTPVKELNKLNCQFWQGSDQMNAHIQ